MKNIIAGLFLLFGAGSVLAAPSDNPFFKKYDTKFGIPPFEKIKVEHYMPAFKKGIEEQKKEINDIVNSKQAPTFQNTVEALEYSGELLSNVQSVFSNLSGSNTSKELQAVAKEVTPLLSKHGDDISFNDKLFARIKAVYNNEKEKSKLTGEQKRLLEESYMGFVRSGANLSPEQKERMRKINEELSNLALKFGDNVLAETNSFKLIIEKKEDLSGLPEGLIAGAAEDAKAAGMDGKWLFTLQNPSVMPFLQYADNRGLREKIAKAYYMRGDNNNEFDNKETIKKIVALRLEKAQIMGYKNFAEMTLENTMAKKPENVNKLLNQLWTACLPNLKKEAIELQNMIDRSGEKVKLEAWDWRYYSEKLRKEKYDLDEEATRPYFKLENVRDALFSLYSKLWGLKIIPRNDLPKYHPDVQTYEIQEANGKHIAILMMDFFPRESKRGGAWMSNFRDQYVDEKGNFVSPIVTTVLNFSKPSGDTPALLTFDESETLFHECGHAIHGMLSKCHYKSLSGTAVPRDFVEFPSQILENWVGEPEFLKTFAKHYKTGEVIPDQLLEKLEKSKYFNQGFTTGEYLAASILDMDWHTVQDVTNIDVNKFENESLSKMGLIPEVIVRYRSPYFCHIFGGGYSAGYYSYIWSAVLDTDGFEAFKEHGLFDPATAKAYRENILEKGYTDDPMELYKKFRGHEPSIEPLLKKRGLNKGL